ncbi:LysR family transcriptional regulator [Donghicola mangrovi]|uniref:LysR family transcriptional regulator n=1 Tax=Donghicola mangrovi TaxID=2729614 RepID=A0A850Q7F1_9RHOB|nr:LysR family transcriptional regulator [Donghicola mangrovi]NVO22670.1 LysR family transcriptional regulator [Donghicola mangrovi]
MQFDWEDIRYFLETERAGRMALAARRLGVSHTTVARHIERLERSIGTQVFERSDEGMLLTEVGERILSHAREMERTALALGDQLGDGRAEQLSGVVRVGAPDGFGNAVLSHILPQLLRTSPGLQIELVPVPRTHKLWKRDVDIAISLDRPQTGRLIMRKLVDYDLRLYGAPELLADPPRDVQDLTAYPFVGYIDDLLYTGELDFNRLIHPQLRTAYKAATVKAQLDAVRAGAGLGVLPCFMAAQTGLIPVLPEEVQFNRRYWLLYPEEFRDLARIRRVADFIVDGVRSSPAQFTYDPQ